MDSPGKRVGPTSYPDGWADYILPDSEPGRDDQMKPFDSLPDVNDNPESPREPVSPSEVNHDLPPLPDI